MDRKHFQAIRLYLYEIEKQEKWSVVIEIKIIIILWDNDGEKTGHGFHGISETL